MMERRTNKMGAIWVIVGESSRATLYSLDSRTAPMTEIQCYVHTAARQHEHELTADLPGEGFDGKNKGQHSLVSKTSHKDKEAQDFAKELGEILENGRLKSQYDQLVLCASPHFLGLLRQQITSLTNSRVVAEIDKNLIKSPPAEIERHIHDALFS